MKDYSIYCYLICLLLIFDTGIMNESDRTDKPEMTTSQPSQNCSEQQHNVDTMFKCKDGTCIGKNQTCDGVAHCKDNEDESFEKCGCLKYEFACTESRMCIAEMRRCDKKVDCGEFGEDEKGCETHMCSKTQFKCRNHFCISNDLYCDFKDDCGDGSDELGCARRGCWYTEFECDNQECIRPGMVCDDVPDCLDGSDERNCTKETVCENGRRVHQKHICNDWLECKGNHADELNCGCDNSQDDRFVCPNTRCINKSQVCDGVCDCLGDCSDEENCGKYYVKKNGYLICNVGYAISCKSTQDAEVIERCIAPEFICNGFNDCYNGHANISDEFGCYKSGEDIRNQTTITCGGQDKRSLPKERVCDFEVDCLHGEDEEDCAPEKCTAGQFQCDNQQCINMTLRCNAHADCFDKSDETNCTDFVCPTSGIFSNEVTSMEEQIPLKQCRNGQCIEAKYWCDFIDDCADGSDEDSCDPPRDCRADEFQCKTRNQCIPKKYRCFNDGHFRSGCADKSHLQGCGNFTCPNGTFKCRNGPCLDNSLVCDRYIHCDDFWTDEENCTDVCLDVCHCTDRTLNCTNLGLRSLPRLDMLEDPIDYFYFASNNLSEALKEGVFDIIANASILDLSSNSITVLGSNLFVNLQRLKSLILQNNRIIALASRTFDGLSFLNGLHLEGNRIQSLAPEAFYGLATLPTLNLRGQGLVNISKGAFRGLSNLSTLDLSQNGIEYLPDGSLWGLSRIISLDLRGNPLRTIGSQVFRSDSLQTLLFDEFRFCCYARHVQKCLPRSDEFSSCEDLMSNFVLRICVWILGIVATLGNLLVIGWRIKYKHSNRVHSFLITNLAIGDFFMGCYLLVIATVDAQYRGVYSTHDKEWRTSRTCSMAGFLSTLSSELSVFTLTVITLDRFLVIIFPFRISRLEMHQTRWVMLCVWLGAILLSGLPLTSNDYFKDFYGRSGVCLALHITPDKPSGWEYSVFIFLFLNLVSFSIIAVGYIWMYGVAKTTRLAVNRQAESKRAEAAMARRMTLIVATDAACWVPIIFLGVLSLSGITVPPQVFAWVAVFILPLNAAVNPVLYTISTASFLDPATQNIRHFNRSFKMSLSNDPRTRRTYSTNLGEKKKSVEEPR